MLKLALLFLAIALGVIADDVTQNNLCEKGWFFHDGMCYLMRDEYETFQDAVATCKLFGSQLAYAKDANTLAFISKLVSKRNLFGWWYGVKMTYNSGVMLYDPDSGYFNRQKDEEKPVPLPKQYIATTPKTSCVGLVVSQQKVYRMIDVACTDSLPYVCRGDINAVKLQKDEDKAHVVRNSTTDVYWFSSRSDRRSYTDAVKSCQSKKMTLLSVKSVDQMHIIVDEIDKRRDGHVDPWWIGLQVNNGKRSWSSGVYVEDSVIIPSEGLRWSPMCRIILSDGTMYTQQCFHEKAPMICMREHSLVGQFGCPHKWFRAGTSCYNMPAGKYTLKTQTEAERICSKAGGYPISVDTPLEKIWFMHSSFEAGSYSRGVWTSLKKKDGHFVGANSKVPPNSVLTWSQGSYLLENGNCFNLQQKTLRRTRCEYTNYAACQYSAINGNCVSSNWKYLNGNCYWDVSKQKIWTAYPTMLQICYADVYKYDSSIVVSPLKVDNTDVFSLFTNVNKYDQFWVGLHEKSHGVYVWDDGTAADLSIFITSRKTGGANSTSSCTFIDLQGNFAARSCDTCTCGRVLCEKDLTGGGNSVTSSFFVQIVMMFCVMSVVYRHL